MPACSSPSHASFADPGPAALPALVAQQVAAAGGWLPFDRFMHLALYAPKLGYYAGGARTFGLHAGDGSDFVTAPELSPLFGQTLAAQVAEALAATGTDEVWEFGAGSGALAAQVLDELARLGRPVRRYVIVEVSAALRARQQQRLAAHAHCVHWVDALPHALRGVLIGNEVLDAMPVQLLARRQGVWRERGVALADAATPLSPIAQGFGAMKKEVTEGQAPQGQTPAFIWQDRPTDARPPVDVPGTHDYVTELHPHAHAFMATVAEALLRGGAGAAFFVDYGFPEAEYYHPQRDTGTLVCHRAHRMDAEPLQDLGRKDITAHVNFTGIALAGQDAGLHVLGYTSQARFLLNAGLAQRMEAATLPERANAMKLLAEHEMGELFKVIAFGTHAWAPSGFAQGDRSHRL